uniref:Uncharacterized protein n=1 Tax=Anguilla anguilla TaxID=7936 RepID=A0A0E9R5Q6_ANGAN
MNIFLLLTEAINHRDKTFMHLIAITQTLEFTIRCASLKSVINVLPLVPVSIFLSKFTFSLF